MGCAAPIDVLKNSPFTDTVALAVAFGLAVEPIIRADYSKHLGRRGFFPTQEKDFADIHSGFSNTTLYISFIKKHNPQLSTSQLISLSAQSLLKIPDLMTDDAPRRTEFYEIKPNSVTGRQAGTNKISEIGALYDSFSLPYKPGRIYTPNVTIRLFEADFSVGHVTNDLHFTRIKDGLIVYELCQNSPPNSAPIIEVLFENIMVAVIIAFIGASRSVEVAAAARSNTPNSLMSIAGSVGRNGNNKSTDAGIVQFLLNEIFLKTSGTPLLKLDGIVGPKTIGAIERFQTRSSLFADGRVDPNGRTISRLTTQLNNIISLGLRTTLIV